ncbi:hypothetical protein [Candidatus Thiodiazotropha sp. LNASS1]|uniref:P-type ATPase n=1 Tax=Candidatus Thiodiazotropha sp. LNASS1 TaxID=3096260 RepID=UPI0034DDFE3F
MPRPCYSVFHTVLIYVLMIVGILVIALFTFFYGVVLQDYRMTEMFLASISLVVAAIPEELSATMTTTPAIGVQRMAYTW